MSRALLIPILPVCLALVQCTPKAPSLTVNMHAGQPPGPALKSGDKVGRKDAITFSVNNASADDGWLMALAVDSAERIFWLQPLATPDARSIRIPPKTPQPLGLGPVTLEAAAAGTLNVVMLFSEAPLPAVGVNEQVRMGGYQAVRGIEGVTQVVTYPLVLN